MDYHYFIFWGISAFRLSSSFDVQGVYKEVDFARRGFVYNGGYPV
jgi:hypothetical protein